MATYYIATNGSDANPGTLAEPWLTVGHAQTEVQAAIAGGMSETVRVYLRGGIYRIDTGLSFGDDDSGRDGFKVIWQSYPGENAVISGGEAITGWTAHTGGIFKADITPGRDFRSIYVNGAHATRARGELSPAGWTAAEGGYTAPDDSMASWGNKTAIEIVTKSGWQNVRCKVATIVGTAVTMQDPGWSLQVALRTWGIADTPYWIENAYELMASGYWYLDKTASALYYWPPGGTMTGLTVVAPKVETLLTLDGASNIRFLNLAFHHSSWTAPETSGYGYFGNNNYLIDENWFTNEPLPPPAVLINNSSAVELRHLDLMHLASALAISVQESSADVVIDACYFDDNAGAPIQIGTGYDAANQEDTPTVTNCYLGPNNFYDFESGASIHVANADAANVEHNELDLGALGWSGIVFNSHTIGTLNNSAVARNYIHRAAGARYHDGGLVHVTRVQSDAAAFATGLTVEENCFDNTRSPGAVGAHSNVYADFNTAWVTVNNNLMRGGSWWFWLYVPQATADHIHADGNIEDGQVFSSSGGADVTETNTTTIGASEPVYGTRAYAIKRAAGISWGVRPGAQPNNYAQRYPVEDGHTLASESPWPRLGEQ
jgi:hypothetical protein